jgi:hypothetical protein
MSKPKDFSRIMEKGTAKQRALLFFDNMLETRFDFGKPFLTEAEMNKLYASFKTPAEAKLYNYFDRAGDGIESGLKGLILRQYAYKETIAKLQGFCYLYQAYVQFEETLNELYLSVEDPKAKSALVSAMKAREGAYFFAMIGPAENMEKDGIVIKPRRKPALRGEAEPEQPKEPHIRASLKNHSEKAKIQLSFAKTELKAVRDYMKETGLILRLYNEQLDEVEADMKEDKGNLFLTRFSKKASLEMGGANGDDPRDAQRIEALFGKDWFFPDYDEAEIAEDVYKLCRERML